MNGWPIIRRDDLFKCGLLEAVCPHGVGHPIPESVAILAKKGGLMPWGVHGCDGCCAPREKT